MIADRPPIGWPRAFLMVAAIAAVGAIVFAIVPNLMLTKLSLARGWRVALATAWFSVGVAASSWVMRRLQSAGVV